MELRLLIITFRCKLNWSWPKGQKFWCILFEDLPSVSDTQVNADIDTINILHTEIHNIKSLQQVPYCKHIHNTLHISSINSKFTIKDNILLKIIQDADNSFEALVAPDH